MIQNVEITLKNWKFLIKNETIVIWQKHACQNMVAMETSKSMDKEGWCQNVPR